MLDVNSNKAGRHDEIATVYTIPQVNMNLFEDVPVPNPRVEWHLSGFSSTQCGISETLRQDIIHV